MYLAFEVASDMQIMSTVPAINIDLSNLLDNTIHPYNGIPIQIFKISRITHNSNDDRSQTKCKAIMAIPKLVV